MPGARQYRVKLAGPGRRGPAWRAAVQQAAAAARTGGAR